MAIWPSLNFPMTFNNSVNKKLLLSSLFVFLVFYTISYGQNSSYPKDYYQFPIRPGLSNSMAGGLGDLRTNHFHAGVDIRTQQREGLSVYAAAKGYVYKVAVQRGGYGNVIYLRHPNGQTTVYGHLLRFSKELADFVRTKQYEKETFEIDLFPEPNQFFFEKGAVIAFSGNTGGSAGPHLHFEIRDSQDNYMNPLYFNFREIIDNKPPKFVSLAIRPLDINGRVNQKFERTQFKPILLKDGSYKLTQKVTATGIVGIDLQAFDEMTGTGFRYGLQCIEIKMDGQEIFSYNMEFLPNRATRDYNNLIDYATDQATGQRYLKCYVPDGNQFDLYKTDILKGKIQIGDTLEHRIQITISDSFENSSKLIFDIKGEISSEVVSFNSATTPARIDSEIIDNTFLVKAVLNSGDAPKALVYANGKQMEIQPINYENNVAQYLLDLRKILPDSVVIGKSVLVTNLKTKLLPKILQKFSSKNWSIETSPSSLFDTLYLEAKYNPASLIINNEGVALRDYLQLTFKPEITPVFKDRSHVYRYVNGDYRFVGGDWSGDVISFETRELGVFAVLTDTIVPKVRLIEQSQNQIRGYISDDNSGIAAFRAIVNNQWVLLNYDYKRNYIWSEKLLNLPFDGELTIEVTDRAGNSTILHSKIVSKTINAKKK